MALVAFAPACWDDDDGPTVSGTPPASSTAGDDSRPGTGSTQLDASRGTAADARVADQASPDAATTTNTDAGGTCSYNGSTFDCARFTATASSVVDETTGLEWDLASSSGLYNWEGAKSYCSGRGWALPSLDQALTIAGEFPFYDDTSCWTSTPVPGDPTGVWGVYFETGTKGGRGVNGLGRVRCTR